MDLDELRSSLKDVFWQWDPLGVGESGMDRYDSMLAPLLGKLHVGAGRAEISKLLWSELKDRPGLVLDREDVDSMAGDVVACTKPLRSKWRYGYWMRRPEPGIALCLLVTLLLLLAWIASHEWVPLIGALLMAACGAFLWWTRAGWRYNAEEWRHHHDAF